MDAQEPFCASTCKFLFTLGCPKSFLAYCGPTFNSLYVSYKTGIFFSWKYIVLYLEKSLPFPQVKYRFTYTVKSPSGKLSIVTDAADNRIQLMRNGQGEVTSIENPLKVHYKNENIHCRRQGSTKLYKLNPLMAIGNYSYQFLICCPRDAVSRTANVEGTARH